LGSLAQSKNRATQSLIIMMKIDFIHPDAAYRVLCVGAHCDDIEIGCGGTILKLIETYNNITFYWVVLSSNEQRAQEAWVSADTFLKDASAKKVIVKNFRDGFLPFYGIEVKDFFEQLKQEFSPDLILTHYRQDLHQDHRLVSDLTWNTFRNHLILEYEIPKYDGDLGIPNFFVNLDESICQQKIKSILESFPSQQNKQWFDEETFRSLLRIRGLEANSPSKYAEAFYCRKMVF
jgi:LmbE family N-acetylglucosaminyl deacetylase